MNHSVYSEILTSLGWFDTGMGKPEPFCADYRVLTNQPYGPGDIQDTTRIAYYPGCFAEFHDGHMAVIRQVLSILKEEGGDYRLIIAPANSDYTMSKYGDVLQAYNKYRYDRIGRTHHVNRVGEHTEFMLQKFDKLEELHRKNSHKYATKGITHYNPVFL